MALRADTIREFGELFERDEPPRAQTHRAVVTAVDGGTVYVDVSGNGDVTPIETTSAGYAIGDEVQVEQRGGRLHVSGNVTQPSVGAQHVEQAVAPVARTAAQAKSASQSAKRAASEAAEVANAVNQHFFSDTDGVHVTEAEQEEWTSSHTGKNILINSLGILLRNALNNLVSITASAIAFFDGSGNSASNVVAQFGASGAQIGKSGESHMELDYHSLQLVDKEGDAYFHVSDLREVDGTAEITEQFEAEFWGTFSENFGFQVEAVDTSYSVSIEDSNGNDITSQFTITKYVGNVVVAPNVADIGLAVTTVTYYTEDARAKAFTFGTRASGKQSGILSYSEGYDNEASNLYTHAEGMSTSASQWGAHSEGLYTKASGQPSHAEGQGAVASGNASHAQNYYTIADGYAQTAIGQFNEAGANAAFIIGNGTSDADRSNAFRVDWDGYIYPMDEKMPDWVVAQGTSGIWTYRKWHSGIAECWGIHAASFAVNTSSATYGGYRSAEQTANFPSGLFTSTPSATATGGAGYVGCWVSNAQSTSSTAFKFFASCGASLSSSSRSTHIHAMGKWK